MEDIRPLAVPPVTMSSIVFVGGNFPINMFDERQVFGGNLDEDSQLKVGPVGQFKFSGGMYAFEITPNRIDLKSYKQELIPDEMSTAARGIADKLDKVRTAIPVTGVGLNCEIVYGAEAIGVEGSEYCKRLGAEYLKELAGTNAVQPFTRMRFGSGPIVYEIRIEPEEKSAGRNLYVAANAHQNIGAELLNEKLDAISEFKKYMTEFHARLVVKPERSTSTKE